ncbi:alpha/beta fold hydrolase [Capillimicrobium parvum]|uniref:AB hydrolase superfamily protein YdjP n=1 Tax=Capillimicrobium parvum TaxID=2884022 RepID=A0A9E7C218_9ACTN|nr:alpha/beta hydrolase [Capillimicrobium parvum]UGS37003.1 AB hydrolase superfamily protein YdjP [Capillimicrobium parvum]
MTTPSTIDPPQPVATGPVRERDVRGGAGTRLHVREWGDPDGPPIVFVHGWSQADLCWRRQVSGPLGATFRLITFDNRGHGRSEKPLDPASYADGDLWAADLDAVIEQTGLERPVLVAWSYGALIVADYLRVHGDAAIGGIDLVGGAAVLRPPAFDHIGPAFLDAAPRACSSDLETSIPALQRFLRACTARPLDDETSSAALCWSMLTPPEVRGALLARELDATDVLARVEVPVLVTHGRRDAIILPSMAEHVLAACPAAVASWYEDAGHMPFLEDATRFDRELAAFADARRSP